MDGEIRGMVRLGGVEIRGMEILGGGGEIRGMVGLGGW